MAAEGAGGEGFEERVKRLFGSRLFDDVPGSSFPAASWSVAAGEVERRRWAKPSEARDAEEEREGAEQRGDTPCASAFYDANGCLRAGGGRRRRGRSKQEEFEGDLGEDEEEEEEGEEEERGGGGRKQQQQEEDEEEGVRVSIGLDPTLDREEEEDKYDREAFGREDAADRVYMNEIMDDGINMSINTVVPDILDDSVEEIHRFSRDPRADFSAASARLKEYDSSAKGGTSSLAETKESPTGGIQAMKTDDANVKPILKRKEEQDDSKPRKRVKFAADVKDQSAELPEQDEDSPMVPQSMDLVIGKDSSAPSESPGVPDYVKNPTKYTRYTLDTPECNDESNRRAFADLHDLLRRMEPDPAAPVEIPTSVTFIPRKKSVDAMTVDEGPKSSESNSSLVGLAAGASDETEQCEMDEDDPKASPPPQIQTNTKMNSRRYRSSRTDDE
uniref:U5 small nuclear ribonucleoprotein TSSC4 n=1 Tax=Leersia perrieri TaxID=77586 RepID=A0A0D9W4E0_9ORYZ